MNRFFCSLLGAAVLLGPAGVAAAQSDSPELPEANPGRPTVSTPATLTPVGYLQLENGGLYANDSPEFATRFGINQVTKLALTSRVQLLSLTEPFTHSTGAEVNGNRPGEVFVGIQTALLKGEEHRPAISVSYIRRQSPAPEIDIDTFSQSALVLVSNDMAGFHFDLNGIVTEQAENGLRRAQFGQTLSISHPVGIFTISGELWHFSQPRQMEMQSAISGRSRIQLRRNLVIDAGFNHGFMSSSSRWEGFGGVHLPSSPYTLEDENT